MLFRPTPKQAQTMGPEPPAPYSSRNCRGAIHHPAHVRGDFGEVDEEDQVRNLAAIEGNRRVLSSYRLPTVVWVITEADRSATTLLLPSEY